MESNIGKFITPDEQQEMSTRLEQYYSNITERLLNLNVTGVTPRTFQHWKSEGLVDHEIEDDGEKRSWVRLNIFDFMWLKILKHARDFGLPIPILIELKNFILLDPLVELIKNPDAMRAHAIEVLGITDEEEIESHLELTRQSIAAKPYLPPEAKFLTTQLGTMVLILIFKNWDVNLNVVKDEDGFKFFFIPLGDHPSMNQLSEPLFDTPYLTIPLLPMFKEFLDEPKNDKNLDAWGFIRKDERRVLDAIRNKTFLEVVITRKKGTDDFIINATIEEDVLAHKAKEICRILGMKDYSEVTVKLRNDKHLYVKNKIKL